MSAAIFPGVSGARTRPLREETRGRAEAEGGEVPGGNSLSHNTGEAVTWINRAQPGFNRA